MSADLHKTLSLAADSAIKADEALTRGDTEELAAAVAALVSNADAARISPNTEEKTMSTENTAEFVPNFDLLATAFTQMKERAQENSQIDRDAQPVTDELIKNLDWVHKTLRDGSDEADPRTGQRLSAEEPFPPPDEAKPRDVRHFPLAIIQVPNAGGVRYAVDIGKTPPGYVFREWVDLFIVLKDDSVYRKFAIDRTVLSGVIDALQMARDLGSGGEPDMLEEDLPF